MAKVCFKIDFNIQDCAFFEFQKIKNSFASVLTALIVFRKTWFKKTEIKKNRRKKNRKKTEIKITEIKKRKLKNGNWKTEK